MKAIALAIWLGAAVQADVQRFPQDVIPNRLDGSVAGWTVFGGAQPRRHLAVAADWTADTILDAQSLPLVIDGRTVTIQSTLSHRTRTIAALGGFTHILGRVRLSYLVGPGWMKVQRTFTTDAASSVLLSPSDTLAPSTTTTVDRSVVPVGGVDALWRLTRHLSVFGGTRIHPIAVEPDDLSGVSIRMMVGGAWIF